MLGERLERWPEPRGGPSLDMPGKWLEVEGERHDHLVGEARGRRARRDHVAAMRSRSDNDRG